MRPEDLRDWLLQLPFRPFRLYLLEATTFDVYHSEFVVVKRSAVDLYFSETPSTGSADPTQSYHRPLTHHAHRGPSALRACSGKRRLTRRLPG